MRLDARVSKLENIRGSIDSVAANYDDEADYRGHETYVVLRDGTVTAIDRDLSSWPDELTLWESRPSGAKFLRLAGSEMTEIIDGAVRPVRFRPDELSRLTIEPFNELLNGGRDERT